MEKKPEKEWKRELTPEQYEVLRNKGTEPAFTGEYWDHHEPGTYHCAACGNPLFDSRTKFDSGSGWPSFWEPIEEEQVDYETDTKLLYPRKEVLCQHCGSHLGHVFDDGPPPAGKRYCINSISLDFKRKQ